MKTLSEVSKELNVSAQAVRRYIKEGKLKATKQQKGLRYYYLISDTDLNEFKSSIK